jgi:hypothetical protein
MTLQEFSEILEQYTPEGFTYWAGHNRAMYNAEKQISDTLLVVLPNPYPVEWRAKCWYTVQVQLWFGKLLTIKPTTTGDQQHNPYSPIEVRDEVYNIADEYLEQLNTDYNIQVNQDVIQGTFYDSPDGQSVNRQVWLQVPVTLKVYSTGT